MSREEKKVITLDWFIPKPRSLKAMINDKANNISSRQTNTWGTYAQTPETTQSSLEIPLPEKVARKSGGDLGQRTWPARISASPNNADEIKQG